MQARLFSDIFSAAFAFFPVLRATNQAQVAEAKATLTHGLQVLKTHHLGFGACQLRQLFHTAPACPH